MENAMQRPTDEELSAWLLGTLARGRTESVEAWVVGNPASTEILKGLSPHDALTDALFHFGIPPVRSSGKADGR